MTQIYSAMTGDGLYGNNLANGLDTNTDVEFKSLSNNTVASGGNDIACFDARPYWSILNDTWNNMYSVINYTNDFLQELESSDLYSEEIAKEGPTEVQQMYGEVKALRAMLYLDFGREAGQWTANLYSSNENLQYQQMISLLWGWLIVMKSWNI